MTICWTRRAVLRTGASAAGACLLGPLGLARADAVAPLITKPIPSTGEMVPVVGLGTNNYGVEASEDLASRREVLRQMPELGGSVVDTAPAYGLSESVIGRLLAELGNRQRIFLASKVTSPEDDAGPGISMLEESFRRLRVSTIDLMQVHNLRGVDAMLPILQEWKSAKRVRYLGVTTSSAEQHADLIEVMLRYRLDFVQVNYSIEDRAADKRILPLARERGIAVLLNVPFGGRRGNNLLQRVAGKALPPWAADIGALSWAQFFLKYAVSHPAVTCAIPGTTRLQHLQDNQQAARGILLDADTRARMEAYWDAGD